MVDPAPHHSPCDPRSRDPAPDASLNLAALAHRSPCHGTPSPSPPTPEAAPLSMRPTAPPMPQSHRCFALAGTNSRCALHKANLNGAVLRPLARLYSSLPIRRAEGRTEVKNIPLKLQRQWRPDRFVTA